jgi:putative oxidoreductase|tara:strand:+ start:344 stop:715 length:372 start_codon:yes stop_codon:yes gene_type:complete
MGVYFILPGISKIVDFEGTSGYMANHGVPLVSLLLVITIILQLALGLFMIVGFQTKLTAFLLAGMVLVISIFMHNFWSMEDGINKTHETQNFFKNMGIMAGLLMISSLGGGQLSIDSRNASQS